MEHSALIIIDMQVALVKGAYREQDVLAHIGALITRCRVADIPVIYIQHNHATFKPMMKGQPGWQIHAAIAPETQDFVIEKQASDAFFKTTLTATLEKLAVKSIMVAGMQTEFCVDTTARSALNHGFNVALLSDCHTTGDAALPAKEIIRHHNRTLPSVVHPVSAICALESVEVVFASCE